MWASELPADSVVVLGGKDNMIPVADVHQLLSSAATSAKRVRLIYEQDCAHGAFLLDGRLQDHIIGMGQSPAAPAIVPPVAPATGSASWASAAASDGPVHPIVAPLADYPSLLPKWLSVAFPKVVMQCDGSNEIDEDARDYASVLAMLESQDAILHGHIHSLGDITVPPPRTSTVLRSPLGCSGYSPDSVCRQGRQPVIPASVPRRSAPTTPLRPRISQQFLQRSVARSNKCLRLGSRTPIPM